MVEAVNNGGKTDAEMSLAIENVCAMVGSEDVDQVIALL